MSHFRSSCRVPLPIGLWKREDVVEVRSQELGDISLRRSGAQLRRSKMNSSQVVP